MSEPMDAILWPYAFDQGGRLARERSYAAHVEQLIRQVLLTAPGERAHRPDFGCGLPRMVFAPNSEASAQLLQVMVVQSLDRWLGSVLRVDDVKVSASDELLQVRIAYYLKARGERRYLNLEVTP
jgi:phage baseplate assembly protein W